MGGHIRRSSFFERYVIIDEQRAERYGTYGFSKKDYYGKSKYFSYCLYCKSDEPEMKKEIWIYPNPKTKDEKHQWQVKVCPHQCPTQKIEGNIEENYVFHFMIKGDSQNGALGAHEVCIEHPNHDCGMEDVPIEHVEIILRAYQARLIELYKVQQIKYVTIYKKVDPTSETSEGHPHAQIIGTSVIPPLNRQELDGAMKYHFMHKRCWLCSDIKFYAGTGIDIHDELERELFRFPRGAFIISQNSQFMAIAPFVPECEWEVHILPKRHCHDYRFATADEIKSFSQILKDILCRFKKVLGDIGYIMVTRTAPNYEAEVRNGSTDKWSSIAKDYHWHCKILPINNNPLGFEKASGITILSIAPEKWAKFLREAL